MPLCVIYVNQVLFLEAEMSRRCVTYRAHMRCLMVNLCIGSLVTSLVAETNRFSWPLGGSRHQFPCSRRTTQTFGNWNVETSKVYFRAFGGLKSIRMNSKWFLIIIPALQTARGHEIRTEWRSNLISEFHLEIIVTLLVRSRSHFAFQRENDGLRPVKAS